MSESKSFPAKNAWAIMDASGKIAIAFSSFISADMRNESQVVSAPVEEGGFASYNKTDTPFEISVSLGFQGMDGELQAALATLARLRESTELVSLVTPDSEYRSLTLKGFNYRRSREDGLGVLFVDLSFVEVRQVATRYVNVRLAERKKRGKQQPDSKLSAETLEKMRNLLDIVQGVIGGGA